MSVKTAFYTALVAVVAAFFFAKVSGADVCASIDQPNPISQQYPDLPTGTFNGTVLVIPIPLRRATELIPSGVSILVDAYRDLLPGFDPEMYPLLLQGGHDHGIQFYAINFTVPDFAKAGFLFPFLDLLGDGYTSFAWTPAQLLSSDSPVAIAGSTALGQIPYPATFYPPCDAYAAAGESTLFVAEDSANGTFVHMETQTMSDLGHGNHYPLRFFVNVTNQPLFATVNGICDGMTRFWNSTFETDTHFKPRRVKGHASAVIPPVPADLLESCGTLYGVQADTPFLEKTTIPCASLQGWAGSGPGDSSLFTQG